MVIRRGALVFDRVLFFHTVSNIAVESAIFSLIFHSYMEFSNVSNK